MASTRKKLTGDERKAAARSVARGESLRSVANRFGVSHVTILRLAEEPAEFEASGQYTAMEVAVIVAVADAGIPSGLTFLAEVLGGSLLDVVEVVKKFRGASQGDAQ